MKLITRIKNIFKKEAPPPRIEYLCSGRYGCNEWKDENEFAVSKGRRDRTCGECRNKHNRERRASRKNTVVKGCIHHKFAPLFESSITKYGVRVCAEDHSIKPVYVCNGLNPDGCKYYEVSKE